MSPLHLVTVTVLAGGCALACGADPGAPDRSADQRQATTAPVVGESSSTITEIAVQPSSLSASHHATSARLKLFSDAERRVKSEVVGPITEQILASQTANTSITSPGAAR